MICNNKQYRTPPKSQYVFSRVMAVSVYGSPWRWGVRRSPRRMAVGGKEPKLTQGVLSQIASPVPRSPQHRVLHARGSLELCHMNY